MMQDNSQNNKRKKAINNWDRLMLYKAPRRNRNVQKTNLTAAAGNWIVVVGTIISAIGSTPTTIFSQQTLQDFNLIGNILEAGGSAIVAQTEEDLLNTVGNQLQAIGNLGAVASILNENEQISQLLETQGNALQVLGVGITIQTEGPLTLLQTIANTGNIIQLIGNVIELFADPNTKEGQQMNALGAWIQVVGTIITTLASE